MKGVEDTRTRARTWLDRNLTARVAAGDASGLTVGLDAPSGQALRDQWPMARECALGWRAIAAKLPEGVTLEWGTRLLGAARQELPARLILSSVDAAATWAGGVYPARLSIAHDRWQALTAVFPDTATESVLRTVMDWDRVDLDLLVTTAHWFAVNPVPDGTWTPRQVPVPGLHAKWLDATGRRALIERLTGLDRVHLRARPTQARVTYLDPDHVASGGRRWDIITSGDTLSVPYPPVTVIIVENRDTAFYFPPQIPGGVVVLGNGDAATNLVATARPLMAGARVIYWGDIDADGLRIVSRLRERSHHVETILMDLPTYETYAAYGTPTDQHGKLIKPGDPSTPPSLTPAEAALYERLTDPAWTGYRRIEQERVPLEAAVAAATFGATQPNGHHRISPTFGPPA